MTALIKQNFDKKIAVRGVTLIELMVVLAIIAIISMFATPMFNQHVRLERAESQMQNLFSFMLTAQEHAVSSQLPVIVMPKEKPAVNNGTNGKYWEGDLIMIYLTDYYMENKLGSMDIRDSRFIDKVREHLVELIDDNNDIINVDGLELIADQEIIEPIKGYELKVDIGKLFSDDYFLKNIAGKYMLFYPSGISVIPKFTMMRDERYIATAGHCGPINRYQYSGQDSESYSLQKDVPTPYVVGFHIYDGSETDVVSECKW